jgi:ABC-type glycerol-3-phosphate transport system substrate-binding protein
LLSACGPSAPAEAPVVITFAIPVTTMHFTQANFQSLAEAFHTTNPNVEIRLRSLSMDEIQEAGDLYADLLLDEEWGIDAFFAGRGVTGRLVESGRILNLQPLLEGDPGWDPDDFSSAALAPFEQSGELWAVPTGFAPLVVFYNKDLLDQAGVVYPRPQWTRDDFLATAVVLCRGLPAQDFAFAGACAASVPFVYVHGGSLLDEAGQCQVQDPRTVEALSWYLDLALLHGVTPIWPWPKPSWNRPP